MKFNQHWNIYHSHCKWLVTSYIWGYQCVAYLNTMGLWPVWSHQFLLQWRLTYLLNCELLVKRHLMVEMPMTDFRHYTDLLMTWLTQAELKHLSISQWIEIFESHRTKKLYTLTIHFDGSGHGTVGYPATCKLWPSHKCCELFKLILVNNQLAKPGQTT